MKVAIQSGLKLSANARFHSAPPTAYQIKANPVPCEFELPSGGRVLVCSPQGFAAVRDLAGVDHDSFFASLTRDELLGGDTQASGKSGSIFWFSPDGRFVVKTVEEEELQNLLTTLPKYARHLKDNRDSLLTRYFGAYRFTSSRGDTVNIVVMNNVLDGARHHEVYDLKGTTEDRWVEEKAGKCLKDINFEPVTMRVCSEMHERLHAVLQADTQFLERLHIMDYSLILSIQYLRKDSHGAIHSKPFSKLMGGLEGVACRATAHGSAAEPCIFHIGLVDMLTTYDLKKKVAHALKSSTIGHFCDIDTEPPNVYADRFRKHFLRKVVDSSPEVEASGPCCPAARRIAVTQPDSCFDLLTFDDPVKPSGYAASSSPAPLAAAPATAIGDLLDLDHTATATRKVAVAAQGGSVVNGHPLSFDLLSFSDVGPLAHTLPAPEPAMFDLLA